MDDSVPFCQKFVWQVWRLISSRVDTSRFHPCFWHGMLDFLVSAWGMYPCSPVNSTSGCTSHSWGYLKALKILKSWSVSESSWKSVFLVANSANMVLILQMSAGVEERAEPSNTSGDLYQSVTISCVYTLISIPKALARSKSASLISPLLFNQ